jgi:cytochrome c
MLQEFCMQFKILACAAALCASTSFAFAQGIAEDGKDEFDSKCSKCHSVDATAPPGSGPNLRGVVGAAAGSRPGFVFSDALKGSGLTWSEDNLVKYLEGPGTLVPGNKMATGFTGTSAEIAGDIVAYLKSLGPAQ